MIPNLKKSALAVLCAAAVAPAFAMEGSIGIGAHLVDSGYRDIDARVWPFPAVNVEGEQFYIHALEAGTFLYKTDNQRITLGLSYMPMQFDASKSDDHRMKKLDDRDPSMFANLGYSIAGEWGMVNAGFSFDTMGESDGIMADVNYLKRFDLGNAWGITPQVGISWTSDKYNEYYFGISRSESKRSGLKAYTPDAGISPYARLIADWQFADRWNLYVETSVRFHSDEVKDSPMIDEDTMTSVGAGLTYRF